MYIKIEYFYYYSIGTANKLSQTLHLGITVHTGNQQYCKVITSSLNVIPRRKEELGSTVTGELDRADNVLLRLYTGAVPRLRRVSLTLYLNVLVRPTQSSLWAGQDPRKRRKLHRAGGKGEPTLHRGISQGASTPKLGSQEFLKLGS